MIVEYPQEQMIEAVRQIRAALESVGKIESVCITGPDKPGEVWFFSHDKEPNIMDYTIDETPWRVSFVNGSECHAVMGTSIEDVTARAILLVTGVPAWDRIEAGA